MATFSYFKITDTTVTTISPIDTVSTTTITNNILGAPKFVTICNLDDSGDDCTIDLYLDDGGGTDTKNPIYILHDVVIPGGSTLILERPEINYNSTVYALKFKLTTVAATQLVDIKIEY